MIFHRPKIENRRKEIFCAMRSWNRFGKSFCANYFDYAPQFLPRHELKRHCVYQSKKAVAADRKSEQLTILFTRAANRFPIGIDQGE